MKLKKRKEGGGIIMNYKVLIGCKCVHKKFGEGVIINTDGERVTVDFNGVIKLFSLELMDQFFYFDDEETGKLVLEIIKEIKEKKVAMDAERKAAEKAAERSRAEEAERLAREEGRLKKEKRNKEKTKIQPIHPYIDGRRNNGKHAVFLVCQNNNFHIESKKGFIWAPTHINKGQKEVASHAELEMVKKGDIIFHHFANHIYAIGVAKADCTFRAAGTGHPNAGEVGRYVDLDYHILDNPASTSAFKAEKAMYGSIKYGPFTKRGENKQGFYLSELPN